MLQNEPDRNITVQPADLTRSVLPGESPVTGLPWEGVYLPMLVQIGNESDTVTVNGYSVKSAGIGKRSPWGAQYADIIYEEMLSRGGYTRLAMLFSDCFAQGEPATGVGPVRSGRIGPMRLREAWQGGLVYGGACVGSYLWTDERMQQLRAVSNVQERGLLINFRSAGCSM